jgi:hypothetical protein
VKNLTVDNRDYSTNHSQELPPASPNAIVPRIGSTKDKNNLLSEMGAAEENEDAVAENVENSRSTSKQSDTAKSGKNRKITGNGL